MIIILWYGIDQYDPPLSECYKTERSFKPFVSTLTHTQTHMLHKYTNACNWYLIACIAMCNSFIFRSHQVSVIKARVADELGMPTGNRNFKLG